MQGTIAQVIALTTHGNAFLSGSRPFESSSFYPANSTFTFCEYVRFVHPKWGQAADPGVWLTELKRRGVYGLRMAYSPGNGDSETPDRMLVGLVGGGGHWLIESMTVEGSDSWEGRWEVGEQDRKDRRIWRVTYGRIASQSPTTNRPVREMSTLKEQLAENLQAIAGFARRQKLEDYARAFEAGLARLHSDHPLRGAHPVDLAPEGALPLPAAQLLAAAQDAWVFGAMGSWNDVWFDREEGALYHRLSEDLYQLLNAAIVAAANATAPSDRTA